MEAEAPAKKLNYAGRRAVLVVGDPDLAIAASSSAHVDGGYVLS